MSTTNESPTTTESSVDPDQIVGRLIGILNDASIAVLVSLGYQTGLFETLATLPPATSTQIADAAGLDERYVREWLGGVVTAQLVEYQPESGTYSICPDHAPFLTGAGPDNFARTLQYVTLMGQVTPGIVRAFREGGGLSYADYPGFHDIQAADSGAVLDALLLEQIVPLTGEVDRLRAGIDVADIGCGEGHAINLLAREFPASRFTGLDFEQEAVDAARAEASAWGLSNARFEVHDVSQPAPQTYDLVTAFDTVHDQAHPATVLANVADSLRSGGTFLMADMDASSHLENNLEVPWASFLYTVSTVHCMSVSLAQGGDGLGTVWGVETAERMLGEAGFGDIEQHRLEANPIEVYFVARR